MHRLDMNRCCRNHCLPSGGEGGSHCIHCTPTDPTLPCCLLCGRMINPDHEVLYCNACIESFSCEACGISFNIYEEGPLCDACIVSEHIFNLFATKIQRAWLKYRQRKRNRAIQIIQKRVLEWLYRPDGPMMKKSEKSFNQLIMSQSRA